MIQLSTTVYLDFYVNLADYVRTKAEYTFSFHSLFTDETTVILLNDVTATTRATKFNWKAGDDLSPGQYLVDISQDSVLITQVTAYVQGDVLVAGGNFTEYQSTNTTNYFKG